MHFRPPEEQNDHKVTCGVNTAVLQCVLDSIQQRLDGAGVQANIITSGTGGWVGLTLVLPDVGGLRGLAGLKWLDSATHAVLMQLRQPITMVSARTTDPGKAVACSARA